MTNNSIVQLNKSIIKISINDTKNIFSSFEISINEFYPYIPQTKEVAPGQNITWYVSGPPMSIVQLSLERIANSGGHIHPNTNDNGPKGSLSPSTLTLKDKYPQNYPVLYTAPKISGSVKIISRFSDGTFNVNFNDVRVPGIVAFSGGNGIILTGATDKHPQNHYGLPALNDRIRRLASKFKSEFGKNIIVNDMSLESGGVFDISGQWRPPHQTHQDGRRVDIHSQSMNDAEIRFFRESAEAIGFRRVILEDNPPHWHLEI